MCLARGRTPGRERLVRVHLPQTESFRRAERKTFSWHEQGTVCQGKLPATYGLEFARGLRGDTLTSRDSLPGDLRRRTRMLMCVAPPSKNWWNKLSSWLVGLGV